jgi:leucyl aminopeptidase
MIEVRLSQSAGAHAALAFALRSFDGERVPLDPQDVADEQLRVELDAFAADVEHRGTAGTIHTLARPTRRPSAVVLAGVGGGDEVGWRSAGAALVRAALDRWQAVHVVMPTGTTAEALAGLVEGAMLASYRFRLTSEAGRSAPKLRRVTIQCEVAQGAAEEAFARAIALTDAVALARDLTNTPNAQKSPKWFAERVAAAATRRNGVRLKILERAELEQGGFNGILAVGSGSPRAPRLVELAWRPPVPRGGPKPVHVVLVGKGITFDTGGISLKPLDGMKLMRKDMAGAAAVCAIVLAAADLQLPVRVTALAPLAENLVSGAAYRPGDVIRHYGGLTSEVHNTDAEGRLVLADALAYAVRRLSPDVVVDLATLTGAANVALGKRTAALFSHNDELAAALTRAGIASGENMWRMPIAEDYASALSSDVADVINAPVGGAGAITATLFLREFVGPARDRWAHIDMSAPSWSDSNDGPLSKGATGWGVRAVVRWLSGL